MMNLIGQPNLHPVYVGKLNRWSIALWLLAFLLALSQVSCHSIPKKTEAQKIVDSFTEKVNADLQSHKSTKDVWSENESQYREAGWYMVKVELPASASINVERTESLVSPYLGTAEFSVTSNNSFPKSSREEALDATEFKGSYSMNHKLTYAYQTGSWVLKSEECFDGSGWSYCYQNQDHHGARRRVIDILP